MKLFYIVCMFILLSQASFSQSILIDSLDDAMALSESTEMPVLLIFGADWCDHCKQLKKDIEEKNLEKELDNYIVCYIDIDENKNLKNKFEIKAVPDSRLIIKQKEKNKIIGYNKLKYKKWISNN